MDVEQRIGQLAQLDQRGNAIDSPCGLARRSPGAAAAWAGARSRYRPARRKASRCRTRPRCRPAPPSRTTPASPQPPAPAAARRSGWTCPRRSLAGQHGKPGSKVELQRRDDDEVLRLLRRCNMASLRTSAASAQRGVVAQPQGCKLDQCALRRTDDLRCRPPAGWRGAARRS